MTGETSAAVRAARRRLVPWTGRPGRRRSRLPVLSLAADVVCALAVVLLLGHGEPAVPVLSGAALVVQAVAGLYRRRPAPRVLEDLPRVLGAAVAAVGVAAIAQGVLGVGEVGGTALRALLVQTALLVLARTTAGVLRRRRAV